MLGIGEHTLFAELRRRHVLDNHNVPTWRFKQDGRFVEQRGQYKHPVVGPREYSRAFVTPVGLEWLRELFHSDIQRKTRDLINEIARINPDIGEIEPDKLRELVNEARHIRSWRCLS